MDPITIAVALGAAAAGAVLQAWRVARATGTSTLRVIITPSAAGGPGPIER